MGQEFIDQDLSDSVFWGVDLGRTHFRDVNLTGVTVKNGWFIDVAVDGIVERLMINGVDVTDYVNEHDRWYPLRSMLRPSDAEGMRDAWRALEESWSETIARGAQLTEAQQHRSIDGEWSLIDSLRHLVFAMDKWFTVPVLGEGFHPVALPNTGSIDFGWPDIDLSATPTFDEILAIRRDRAARMTRYLDSLTTDDLARRVEVLENGATDVEDCLRVVFEEEFEHQRYVLRDLDRID